MRQTLDFFQARPDAMIDLKHPLVVLATRLPIRPMYSLIYLKHAFNLSDEDTCERWAENVVWQTFSGMDYCEPRPPCDAT